jgi:hypothetical protein
MPRDITKHIEFIRLIARFNYDGEELENGEEFIMKNDDAVDTLNSLIHNARKLLSETTENNESEILCDALSYWLDKLENDVDSTNDGTGWPEINAEIATVKSLLERL